MNIFLLMNKAMGYMEAEGGGEGGGGGSAPAAPAAPAAAPAPAPAATPASTETDTDAGKGEPVNALEEMGFAKYSAYWADKPAVGVAIEFVAKAGFSFDDPAVRLADEQGDFTLLKAALAAKGIPGTDQMMAILEQEAASATAEVEAAQAAVKGTAYNIMGGEEAAAEKFAWGSTAFSDEEKDAFNGLMDAGGHYATLAIVALNTLYETHSGASKAAASPTANLSAAAAPAGQQLTRQEFGKQMNELAQRLGPGYMNSQEYKTLSARRAQMRNRGI